MPYALPGMLTAWCRGGLRVRAEVMTARVCVCIRRAADRACVCAREHVVGRHTGAEGCELSRVGVPARARWLPAILPSPLRGKYLFPCAACAREQHVGCLSGFCCCVERGPSCPARRLLE